jgi:hypothetical protein
LHPTQQSAANNSVYICSRKKQSLVLSYTIANEEIRLQEKRNGYSSQGGYFQYPGPLQVGIKKTCTHDLSVMNVEGRMLVETDISYQPSEQIGVVACIQQVENPGCMVFSAEQNFALNCSPKIIDILFVQSYIPFTHKYADRSDIKRVDLFIQQKEAERLFNPILLNKLDEHDMIAIKAETKNKRVEELLSAIGKKIQGENLCKYLHELIVCLNELGKWRSRF